MSVTGFQEVCQICKGKELRKILSLGDSPLPNKLLTKQEVELTEEQFPLEFMYCETCHLCQLSYMVPSEKMFSNYLYVTATTKITRDHFSELADTTSEVISLKEGSFVVDVGSNDGFVLSRFAQKGMKVLGIEPAKNLKHIAEERGVETWSEFLSDEVASRLVEEKGKAKLVTALNVFAHIPDIHEVVRNVKKILEENGAFVIENQYVFDTLKTTTFDNIYHEHMYYHSILALKRLFEDHQLEIFRIEHYDNHGGTIRVYVQNLGVRPIQESVNQFLEQEISAGLNTPVPYEEFAKRVYETRSKVAKLLKHLKRRGKRIVAYGAPAKATTLLNFFDVGVELIDYTVEDNSLKHDHIIPGIRLPIKGPSELYENTPDYILILAWNYASEILHNHSGLKEKGVKFIIPLPELRIIE